MKDIVIYAKNISKFGDDGTSVLDNLSLKIYEDEIYGLVGRKNSGKTTICKIISNITHPTYGEVEFFGINEKHKMNQIRKLLGYSIESQNFEDKLTVKENLEFKMLLNGGFSDDFLFKIKELVGLDYLDSAYPSELTEEEKAKLSLVSALSNNPQFVILDGILENLNSGDCRSMKSLIKYLAEQLELTVLITSSSLNKLKGLTNRFGIINDGKIIHEAVEKEISGHSHKNIILNTDETDKTIFILVSELDIPFKDIRRKGNELNINLGDLDLNDIADIITNSGIKINGIKSANMNLDEYMYSVLKSKENIIN